MSEPPDANLPQPGHPRVEWIEGKHFARWVFSTADAVIQLYEFRFWCEYYGYDEQDRPEKVEGDVWFIRSSVSSPRV